MKRIHKELAAAAKERRVVAVDYRPADSEKTKTYLVEPYSYRGDKFFGYDRMSKSIKAFSLMGIVRVTQTQVKFTPRWPVELDDEEKALAGLQKKTA